MNEEVLKLIFNVTVLLDYIFKINLYYSNSKNIPLKFHFSWLKLLAFLRTVSSKRTNLNEF